MRNTIEINSYKATVEYDPDIDMFRGSFININGGADFYAKDIDSLKHEGEVSLNEFLEMCEEDGVNPRKEFSGKLMVRIDPDIHEAVTIAAASKNVSINTWIAESLKHELQA